MTYNSRMSIIPPGQQQQSRGRKKEEISDEIMRLTDEEIVGCINDLGIKLAVSDLQKPQPVHVQMVLEGFARYLLGTTRETVEPAMRAAAEAVCGGRELGDALMPADTRNLMGFCVSLRRLLLVCGVADFSTADLFRPTHDRFAKLTSYLVNFARFRESQLEVIEEHLERAEGVKGRIEDLYAANRELEARLEDMHANRRAMQTQVAEKARRNEELKKRLLELRRNQEKVAARLEDAKDRKSALAAQLEERTATKLAWKHECGKLRPYVTQSPAALQASLAELSGALAGDKAHIDALDRRSRALQTSTDSFAVVSTDVASCIKLLDEVAGELAKEEEETARNAKQRDALTERGANVREVERTEALLRRQLAKWGERTESLREQSQEKAQSAKDKMEELRAVHKRLSEERAEKGKDVERRRVRIEQTEKKMLDLKENIENEVHTTHDEYLKMEAHIKLYITEMEQAI